MESKAIILLIGVFILGASMAAILGLINLSVYILGYMLSNPIKSLIILTILSTIGVTIERYVSRR